MRRQLVMAVAAAVAAVAVSFAVAHGGERQRGPSDPVVRELQSIKQQLRVLRSDQRVLQRAVQDAAHNVRWARSQLAYTCILLRAPTDQTCPSAHGDPSGVHWDTFEPAR